MELWSWIPLWPDDNRATLSTGSIVYPCCVVALYHVTGTTDRYIDGIRIEGNLLACEKSLALDKFEKIIIKEMGVCWFLTSSIGALNKAN